MKATSSKLPLLILLFTNLLDWISIGLVYPMFSSMIFHPNTHFFSPGTSDFIKGTWLGVLLASSPLAQFFSSPIVGALSDQKGRKTLLKNTVLIIIFGYFLCTCGVWIENLALLLIGRSIVGIGTGNVAAIYAAIADISEPEEKPKHFGLASMSSGIGFTLGPFLGGALSRFGFATPFLFAIVISSLNWILIIFFLPETHHVKRKVALSLTLGLKNLKKAFQTPTLCTLFLCFFFFCISWSFYWEFIPVTWIQKYHLSPSQVGNFFAYGAAFYALSSGLLIRPIVGRFRPLPILFYALILLAVAIFVLLLHSEIHAFWIYIPIQQFLIALVFPTVATITSNSVKEDSQGEIMGVLQSVDSFAFGASPLLAGAFVGLSPQAPIIISGIFVIFSCLVLLTNQRKEIFKR